MDHPSPADAPTPTETAPVTIATTNAFPSIAPWWHTLAILLGFALWVIIGHSRSASSSLVSGESRILTYTSQIWLTWLLLAATVAGLYRRRQFFRVTLTQRARPLAVEFRRGALTYFGLYASAILAVSILSAAHLITLDPKQPTATQAARNASSTSTRSANSPLAPPPEPATTRAAPHDLSHLFDNRAVRSLAPHTALELAFWIALSFTAAFVEEHIFRGYLLYQARVAFMRIKLSTRAATIVAIIVTSALFGTLHLYEGAGAACFIGCLGALFAVLALRFANLRAVIVAHFLQDFLAGLILFVHSARTPH